MMTPKPRWWLLYAVLPLAAVLLVAAERLSPSAGWRMIAEGSASLLIIGLVALWVRANRLALAAAGKPPVGEAPLRVWVAYSPAPAFRRRLEIPAGKSTHNLVAWPHQVTDREEEAQCSRR
jgi:hypothetical protein